MKQYINDNGEFWDGKDVTITTNLLVAYDYKTNTYAAPCVYEDADETGMAGKTIRTELAKGGRMRVERMMRMIKYGGIDPAPLVTHRFSGFDKLEEALLLMRDKPSDLIKVVVSVAGEVCDV